MNELNAKKRKLSKCAGEDGESEEEDGDKDWGY